jgi:hypothetical protein
LNIAQVVIDASETATCCTQLPSKMELWCDIFNESLPQFAEQARKAPGLHCKMSFDVAMENPCVALTSIGGRQLQCSTSPKEQIALPIKIDFY